jgi:acetoin utilization protein AcuB
MFVKLWMTSSPITIRQEQTVAEAYGCMQEKCIRRIPVVGNDDELVGIVSRQDIVNAMPSIVDGSTAGSSAFIAQSTKIQDIMTRMPMWVAPTTSLESVAKSMRQHKIGGMPVVEKGRLVGIITESDIFSAFMEVLGAGEDGARIEIIIGKKSSDLYNIVDIFQRYDMDLQAITVHRGFGGNQRLVTIRVRGDELEDMLDVLRQSGAQINRIQTGEEDS